MFSYYGSQWLARSAWLQTYIKYLPLCTAEQKMYTGLEQLEGV